jgi:hypothetical protein
MRDYASRRFSSTRHKLPPNSPPHLYGYCFAVKIPIITSFFVKARGDLMSPGEGIDQTEKDLVKRLAICVSLALAAGLTSFGAFACSDLNDLPV